MDDRRRTKDGLALTAVHGPSSIVHRPSSPQVPHCRSCELLAQRAIDCVVALYHIAGHIEGRQCTDGYERVAFAAEGARLDKYHCGARNLIKLHLQRGNPRSEERR